MNAPETARKSESSSPSNIVPTVFRPQRTYDPRPQVLTLQNAECGVILNVGQEFELDLGITEWHLRVRDEAVLASDGNGTFRAVASGKTRIYATGAPPKNNSGPPVVPRKVLIEIPVTVL